MSDTLTALDATFLELEQRDEGALMGIGGVSVFDPVPGGGAPTVEEMCANLGARLNQLPRYSKRLSSTRTGGLAWPRWIDDDRFRIRRPRDPRGPTRAGRRSGAVRLGRRLLFAPARPHASAVGDGADRGTRRRSVGDRQQDPPLPCRWRRLRRRRLPAARPRAEPARASVLPRPHRPAMTRFCARSSRGRRSRSRTPRTPAPASPVPASTPHCIPAKRWRDRGRWPS